MTMPGNAARVIAPEQARVYQLRLGEARILVDGQQSGGEWWTGVFRQDPGFGTPLHLHVRMDEHFFVLDGVLSLYIEGAWRHLKAGTLALVPRGVAHAQSNFSNLPVATLALGKPAGFERFFAAQHDVMNRLSAQDLQSLTEISKLVAGYDTEVLGPPPRIG